MNKDELAEIINRLDILEYLEDTADYIRVGPYRVNKKTDMSWELVGDDRVRIFSTRMGALGYAKCLLSQDAATAQKIVELDETAGATRSHMESIRRAQRTNDQIGAKVQEAQIRHQENIQLLARTVLDLI